MPPRCECSCCVILLRSFLLDLSCSLQLLNRLSPCTSVRLSLHLCETVLVFHLVLHTSKCCSLFVHLTESYLFFNTMPPRCDCPLFAFLSNGSLAVIPSISDSLSQIIFRLCLTSLRLHTYATSA